ncbi:uncharacterized protein LOC121867686 [Homarus americanus]|uniref:uncharacterized protein LOC121867686 n=1 Tax=Homarus americanus TaxID=6706 RepID=UPI001C443231|nr:uncharacterized protein LOC121867686 [Homarus americanus]
MLLIISTVFILLNLPSYVMRAYGFFWCGERCEKSALFYTLQQTFTLLFYTNFAINFLLYCVTGQNFRRAVGGLCVTARRRFRPPTHHHRSAAHRSPGVTRMPPVSTFERNPTGSVMLNIQLWEGPQHQDTASQHPPDALHPQPGPSTHASPTSNGLNTTVHNEEEDSF